MILGIGVDTVEIERFALWHTYSAKKLSRVFSPEEIDYCLEKIDKSAQRFAVRFAAREALYKALSYVFPDKKIPFLSLCTHVVITKINGRPQVIVSDGLGLDARSLVIHLSLSHSRTLATAFIVLEQR